MAQVLSMEEVSLAFERKQALERLSFSVEEGEIFGFLGPSGAGKTTTIKLLTHQLKADSGQITLFSQPIEEVGREVFEHIGILTDNSGVYERLSVYENLEIFASLGGVSRSRIEEALESVSLWSERKKKAKSLSKGMRQRLILARAILNHPRLLFLDEPTAALDPATTRAIHQLLRQLNQNGTTIFLTTHNMEEADKLCSRVAFLDHGHIVECAPPEQMKLKYAKNEIAALCAGGKRYQVEKSAAGLKQLIDMLGTNEILTLHSSEPNLEDIFLHLTGRTL